MCTGFQMNFEVPCCDFILCVNCSYLVQFGSSRPWQSLKGSDHKAHVNYFHIAKVGRQLLCFRYLYFAFATDHFTITTN